MKKLVFVEEHVAKSITCGSFVAKRHGGRRARGGSRRRESVGEGEERRSETCNIGKQGLRQGVINGCEV